MALGTAGLLALVALIPRLGDRWPLLRGRLFWAPLLLAGLSVLVASLRNTPLGNAPVNWLALLVAAAAVVVALVGLVSNRGGSSVWRWWGLVVLTAVILAGVAIDGFGAYRTQGLSIANEEVQLNGELLVPHGEGPFP
ncbi:MAG: hypothetical protein ACRDU9_10215, partial [Acidimicrobiia bacterium]